MQKKAFCLYGVLMQEIIDNILDILEKSDEFRLQMYE